MKYTKLIKIILASYALSACSQPSHDLHVDLAHDRDHEKDAGYYSAVTGGSDKLDSAADKDPLRKKLSQFFLVEQFNVGANQSMLQAFKDNPPGGVLFWNGEGDDAKKLRENIRIYSQKAEILGLKPMLFSTDYEGGASNYTPSGKTVPGVQRFVKGFTSLAHPRWLGISERKYKQELCSLHGKIMAKELKSVGINYPLSVISDLSTQSLTSLRGVSKDATEVSLCLNSIFDQFATAQDIIFVTKHFPGLGLTQGDTHDGTVVAKTTDQSVLQTHLKPYLDLIANVSTKKTTALLSIMTTHAKFLAYDTEHVTTESPKIVNDLLKGKLNFKGLVVSDAMWMGDYGHMSSAQLMPVYLNTFLSGIDLLMIPGARFAEATRYFRKVYDKQLSESEKQLLTERTQLSWEETYKKFKNRIDESLKLQDRVRGALKPAYQALGDVNQDASFSTTQDSARYKEILSDLRKSDDKLN